MSSHAFFTLARRVVELDGVLRDGDRLQLLSLAARTGIPFAADGREFPQLVRLLAGQGLMLEPDPALPYARPVESVLSSRWLLDHAGEPVYSRIFLADGVIVKQTSGDHAEHEARILRLLDSPSFPRVVASEQRAADSILVMEAVDGAPLSAGLPADAVRFAEGCLEILAALQDAGIVHRDITPDNLLVRDGLPVLIDFGWAVAPGHQLPPALEHDLTAAGLGVDGRPPEGGYCDVYALGVSLAPLASDPHVRALVSRMTAPAGNRVTDPAALAAVLHGEAGAPARPASSRSVRPTQRELIALPSVSENRSGWDGDYDWKERGDEWSRSWGGPDAQWWTTFFPRIRAFVPAGRILEIAPGFGRWTHFLKDLCEELVAVDLSEECAAATRERFAGVPHLSTHVNDGLTLPMVAGNSIDFAITLDSLVHVEQDVLDSYLAEFARVLAPEGVAFVHHSNMGDYGLEPGTAPHWRGTTASARLVEETARSLGLACIAQERLEWGRDTDYLSDAFTVVCRAGSSHERSNVIRDAPQMTVVEGELATRLQELYGRRPAARAAAPAAPPAPEPAVAAPADAPRRRVLVAGVYLADRPNTAREVVASLASEQHEVVQRWIALGSGPSADEAVSVVTVEVIGERTPKYVLLNRLIAGEDLESYDYVVLCDDDIRLPERFLDRFLPVQEQLGLALAQPARTPGSFIDHEITRQEQGVLARQTRFVEIGPVVVVARAAFGAIFPHDESNGMGWGYENVWTLRLEQEGLKLGIVDAVPVDHSLRPPVENYSQDEASEARDRYLETHVHVPLEECQTVLETVYLDGRKVAAEPEPLKNESARSITRSVTDSSPRLPVDDLVLHEDTGVLVLPRSGTAVSYNDGSERYLLDALRGSRDVGLFSPELRHRVHDWASLYHLTPYRATILEALGLTASDAKVLELGAGCGAVTRWLGENFDTVHAVEGSLARAQVIAERTRDQHGVRVAAANFFDLDFVNAYDLTTLIGVLEYSHLYHPEFRHDPWRAALSNLELSRASLREDGLLVIAIENKLGLKYLAGAHEDHAAKPFEGVVGYPSRSSAVTWSAPELERLVAEAGFTGCDFYLPFPDYKLAHTMIDASAVDRSHFPANWIEAPFPDRVEQRTPLYNESLALREIVSAGLLRDLSNSFVVLAYNGDRERVRERLGVESGWVARHYSLDRRAAFAKRTSLEQSTDGGLVVRNVSAAPDAAPAPAQLALVQKLEDEPFRPGHQLQFELLELGAAGQLSGGVNAVVRRLRDFLVDTYGTGVTDGAGIPLLEGEALDAVPSNIVVDPETGEWHAVDREWAFRGLLPLDFVIWRGLNDLVARYGTLLGGSVASRTEQFTLDAIGGVFPSVQRSRLGVYAELEAYVQYAAGSRPTEVELREPPEIVQLLVSLAEAPRDCRVIVFAEELVEHPELLTTYTSAFAAQEPVTLVVYAPDADLDSLVPRLEALLAQAENEPEVVLVNVPREDASERQLAGSARALLSLVPPTGAFTRLPRVEAGGSTRLRQLAFAA